jgi:hypothetical protein
MLSRTFRLLLVACLVTGTVWAANDPFVGKWKVNPSKSKLNDEMKVEVAGANRYAITFAPGLVDTVVADGTDQPGLRGTTLSVTVKGPSSWEVIRKMKGRTLLTAYWTLSEDGKTLNDAYTEYAPDGSPSSVPYVYERTAGSSGFPGTGFPGTWDSDSEKVKSGIELQIEPYEGDGLSLNSPGAEITKKMKFDGNDYPDPDPNGGYRLCIFGPPRQRAQSGNHRQIQRQNYAHPADRAFYRSQDLDDDRAPGGSKPAQEHPCV